MPSPMFKKRKSHFGQPASKAKFAADTGSGAPSGGSVTNPLTLTYFPHLDVFYSQTMDVWTNTTGGTLPPTGPKRISLANILLTGVWSEGHRQKVSASDAYTHIIICDPQIEIRDPYKGNSQALATAYDALSVPGGQTNNYWNVVFSFITLLPDMGRRRIILADRFGAPGSWPTLL